LHQLSLVDSKRHGLTHPQVIEGLVSTVDAQIADVERRAQVGYEVRVGPGSFDIIGRQIVNAINDAGSQF